jgi:hypothetical protein
MKDLLVNDKIMTRTQSVRGIVISPLYNLMVKGTVYDPNLVQSSYKYSWEKVQRYFHKTLQASQPPMHYFAEFLNTDYVFFVGAGISQRSWYLGELSMLGAIPASRADDILVVVDGDFRLENPDKRLLEGLSHYILCPLMRLFKLTRQNVRFIDELFTPDAELRTAQTDRLMSRYALERSKYWDFVQLEIQMKRFKK